MIKKYNFLLFLDKPIFSSKVSYISKKNNIVVFKFKNFCNKIQIKKAIEKIFNIKVEKVRTLLVKGKKKKRGKIIGKTKKWKKVYVFLKKKYKIEQINNKIKKNIIRF